MTVPVREQPDIAYVDDRPLLSTGTAGFRPSNAGLSSKDGLIAWARRDACERILDDPSLLERARDPRDLARLTRAGGRAARGTSIHRYVEMALTGRDLPDLPPDAETDAHAALHWLEQHHVHATELVVESGRLGFVGTIDLVATVDGATVVVDLKTTTRSADYAARWSGLDWAVQLGCYSRGLPWDDQGRPIPWDELSIPEPDTGRAIVLHVNEGTATPIHLSTPDELVDAAAAVQRLRARRYAQL